MLGSSNDNTQCHQYAENHILKYRPVCGLLQPAAISVLSSTPRICSRLPEVKRLRSNRNKKENYVKVLRIRDPWTMLTSASRMHPVRGKGLSHLSS
jgi:hypothetical protein